MRKKLIATAFAVGMTAVGSLALASPASATPVGCSAWADTAASPDQTKSYCPTGSGSYRARATCYNGTYTIYRYGSYVSPGSTSVAYCTSTYPKAIAWTTQYG